MSTYSGGGFWGRCKVLCRGGLGRNVLLDGFFEVVCMFEVVLGKGVRSIESSRNGVSLGSRRVGKWSVAIW